MIITDREEALKFSDNFCKKAAENNGINVIRWLRLWVVVPAEVNADTFDADTHLFCVFRTLRDLQGFLAVRGWTIKEIHEVKEITEKEEAQPPETRSKSRELAEKLSEHFFETGQFAGQTKAETATPVKKRTKKATQKKAKW